MKTARQRAGLTQRELACRAGVPQSTIARIESGTISPRVDTLARILQAMGSELQVRPVGGGLDRSLIRRMLRLTPTERVQYAAAGGETVRALRRGMESATR